MVPARWLVLALLAAGCSSESDGTTNPGPAPVDAAADVSPDGSSPEAMPESGDEASEQDSLQVDVVGDEVAEAGEDASEVPFAHCLKPQPLPSWAAAGTDPWHIVVHAAGMDLRIAALEDGILRLLPIGPGETPSPRALAVANMPQMDAAAIVSGTDTGVQVCTEWCRAEISADGRVRVTDKDGRVSVDDSAGGWEKDPAGGWRLRRATSSSEHFYGFGERNGPLDKRGRRMAFWNTDAYDPAFGGYKPDQDPLYQSIPFFMGLQDGAVYGVLTDNSWRLEMDMASTDPDAYEIHAAGGLLDQYVIAGPTPSEVLRRYTALTGRMRLPPRWSIGYHQSRWGYSPDSKLEELAQQFRTRKIPADALWLDIQHMRGFRTFTWDPSTFPDPQGLMAGLAGQGFQVVVIADPGIKVDPGWEVYDSGLSEGVFLPKPGGGTYTGVVWPGESAFADFTLPAGRSWWGKNIGDEVARGVRGIWLDVNEPTLFPESGGGSTIPGTVQAAGDGTPASMDEVHNAYALHQARATWEGMLAKAPDRRPFVLTRAGYAGIQRWAAVWTGDAPSSWSTLSGTLPMLLGMGLSGLPFVGSDVGGYSGHATPELFARWMALGSLSPFFRGHVTSGVNDQEPWQFGQEVEDLSRDLIGQRYELLPYLYSVFDESVRTGAPVLRPLVYHFPEDPAVWNLGDQAMIGSSLLIAPVMQEGAQQRSIYLPAGRWYELHSGAIVEGPTTIQHTVTLAALPTYVREGGVLFRAARKAFTSEPGDNTLLVDLYPGPQPGSFTLYEDEGDGFAHEQQSKFSRVAYTIERTATGSRLQVGARDGTYVPPSRPAVLRVHRVDHLPTAVKAASNPLAKHASWEELQAAGEGWWWDERDLSLVVMHADATGIEYDFSYEPAIADPKPPVKVVFEVQVPVGTPTSTPVYVASSASGWTQEALAWVGPQTARGTIAVPRGEWFFYKFTRGDWATVEKWPGCVEAANRYGFGAAHPDRVEVVYQWADWCP